MAIRTRPAIAPSSLTRATTVYYLGRTQRATVKRTVSGPTRLPSLSSAVTASR